MEFAGKDFYISRGGNGSYHGSSVVWDKIGKQFEPETPLYMGNDLKLHSNLKII